MVSTFIVKVFELARVPLSTSCKTLYYDKQVNYPDHYKIQNEYGTYKVFCNFNNEFKFYDWKGNKLAQQSLLFGHTKAISMKYNEMPQIKIVGMSKVGYKI